MPLRISNKMDNGEMLKFVFESFDGDKNGDLNCKEVETLFNAMRNALMDSDVELDIWFKFPSMSFEQFKKQLEPYLDHVSRLVEEFHEYDVDKSGYICADDLEAIFFDFGLEIANKEIHDVVEKVDVNGNGKICFKEFLEAGAICFTKLL